MTVKEKLIIHAILKYAASKMYSQTCEDLGEELFNHMSYEEQIGLVREYLDHEKADGAFDDDDEYNEVYNDMASKDNPCTMIQGGPFFEFMASRYLDEIGLPVEN